MTPPADTIRIWPTLPTRPDQDAAIAGVNIKANHDPSDNWLDHQDDVDVAFNYGTINICAPDAAGDLGSVTTTSGLSWKIPGRVGDSPILGAGQYCDNAVGAAGSTGRGEANMKVCGAVSGVGAAGVTGPGLREGERGAEKGPSAAPTG